MQMRVAALWMAIALVPVSAARAEEPEPPTSGEDLRFVDPWDQ